MAREPGYRLHKPTGQAYVRLGGKMFYLGVHGSPESRDKYARLKAEWLASRHAEKFTAATSGGPTVAQLCLAYLDHAEEYYGTDSKELANLKLAMRPLSELYATLPARSFGPLEFRTVRDWWLSAKSRREKPKDGEGTPLSRTYINKQMRRLIRAFKWSVGQGLIPPAVHQTLLCVDALKRGRTSAPEVEPVEPVDPKVVEATLKHLPPILQDMVRVQWLTGCRPGEVCALTPGMIGREGDVWEIRLDHHKTAWRGKGRTIFAGPQAQRILLKYLLRADDAACFSPREADEQRRQARTAARKTPQSCGNKVGTNRKRKPRKKPGEAYTTASYGRAIQYAAGKAKVAIWAPNQLRHTTGTAVRKRFGLEAAQLILGHAAADVTQVYAERDLEKAREIARLIG